MRKLRTKICKNCQEEFLTREKLSKFCTKSCAAKFNNAKKGHKTKTTKEKISLALKEYYKKNPRKKISKEKAIEQGIKSQKGKRKTPKNILCISKRTKSKIMKRIGIGCSNCGWNECVCDIHHIDGKNISDPNNHKNLSYLCPNCHRLVHENILISIKNLDEYFQEHNINWLDYYYG